MWGVYPRPSEPIGYGRPHGDGELVAGVHPGAIVQSSRLRDTLTPDEPRLISGARTVAMSYDVWASSGRYSRRCCQRKYALTSSMTLPSTAPAVSKPPSRNKWNADYVDGDRQDQQRCQRRSARPQAGERHHVHHRHDDRDVPSCRDRLDELEMPRACCRDPASEEETLRASPRIGITRMMLRTTFRTMSMAFFIAGTLQRLAVKYAVRGLIAPERTRRRTTRCNTTV